LYLVFIYDANNRVCMLISWRDVYLIRALVAPNVLFTMLKKRLRLKCLCVHAFCVRAPWVASCSPPFQVDWLPETVGLCCPGSPRPRRACTRNRLTRSMTVEKVRCRDPAVLPRLLWPPHHCRRLFHHSLKMNWIPHYFLLPLKCSSAKRSFVSYLISYWSRTSAETVFMMIPVFELSTVDQKSCRFHQTTSISSLFWLSQVYD
jgi:hypothetical protein